jgi:transposase
VRDWICGGCGASHDRDINSAINILVLGRNVGLQETEIPSLQAGEDVKWTSLQTRCWRGRSGAHVRRSIP